MTTDEEIAALRTATREAHEAIKDLRATIRLAADERRDLTELFPKLTDAAIEEAVRTGLAKLSEQIAVATEEATQKVFHRFDQISEIILGEARSNRRKGEPTMTQMLEFAADRGMFDDHKLVKHEFQPADADGNCKRCGMEAGNELVHRPF